MDVETRIVERGGPDIGGYTNIDRWKKKNKASGLPWQPLTSSSGGAKAPPPHPLSFHNRKIHPYFGCLHLHTPSQPLTPSPTSVSLSLIPRPTCYFFFLFPTSPFCNRVGSGRICGCKFPGRIEARCTRVPISTCPSWQKGRAACYTASLESLLLP